MLCVLLGVLKHGVQKALITNIPLCNPRLLVFLYSINLPATALKTQWLCGFYK